MGVSKAAFGTDKNTGKTVYQYTIENKNGMKAQIINYGAILTHLWVPDLAGELADVVLGYDELESYLSNPCFFGAVIGPSANRIGNASFSIEGKQYKIPVNEGKNNLHSDKEQGYHKRIYEVEEGMNSLSLSIQDMAGTMGFPGNKCVTVIYTLSDQNELRIDYRGESDQKTVLNLTNHSYFNLCGQGNGSIEDHILRINASYYTPTDSGSIPVGNLAEVSGTPLDFRLPKAIGKDIHEKFEQLVMAGGYDHNWVIDNCDGQLQLIAEVSTPRTTRKMDVYSTLPGLQFYAGNFVGDQKGKSGKEYHNRSGLALETQFFPDSVNKELFPNVIFGPERKYVSTTIYAFSND